MSSNLESSEASEDGEVFACGHHTRVQGCGGCDPGAIDFVILEDGSSRPFDPKLDLRY